MLWDANPPIRDASSPTVLAENNAIFWGEYFFESNILQSTVFKAYLGLTQMSNL